MTTLRVQSAYIAGPMSGRPDLNFPLFNRVTASFRKIGWVIINPAESFGGRRDLPMEQYARYDLSALLQVDAIVLLPEWETSVGACTEVAAALWLGLEFLDMWGLHLKRPTLEVWPQKAKVA